MVKNDIDKIIGQAEGQRLEYKSAVLPPSAMARIIAAFANADGGLLILGVREEPPNGLNIVGLPSNVPASAMTEAALARLKPSPSVDHYFFEVDGKHLYVVEVERSESPVLTEDNKIFVRRRDFIEVAPSTATVEEPARIEYDAIAGLFTKIEASKEGATESKSRLLEQFHNLFLISNQATATLGHQHPDKPPPIPYGRMLLRLLFSALVDSFETYLADLLLEVYLAKPETLRSEARVTVKDVLECQGMEEFIRLEASRRVQKLKRGNLKDFVKSFKKSPGLDVFLESEIPVVEEFFQIRHLYTHNSGRVDSQFLTKHRTSSLQIGDEHLMSLQEFCESAEYILSIANRLDSSAVAKFHLDTSDPIKTQDESAP